MHKIKRITALLLAAAISLSLAACGGTNGKEPETSITSASVPTDTFPTEDPAIPSTPSTRTATFSIDIFKYQTLSDVGADHVPVYPAVLFDGSMAMPYGTVETKEIGYTGKMEDVGSTPVSYSLSWDSDDEQRLDDIPIANANGSLLTLSSNIDAAYVFPFDAGQPISAACDELFQAFKDSLTAYADLAAVASTEYYPYLYGYLMELSNGEFYLSGDDIDAAFLDVAFEWSEYLMTALNIDISDLYDENDSKFTSVLDYITWLSSTVSNHIDDSEELRAYKRLIKSFNLPAASLIDLESGYYYVYRDETYKVTVGKNSSDGIDYVLASADFDSVKDLTFGGMALSTADDAVRVFGGPTRVDLSWEPDSGSSDTANAYLPYVTYCWKYAHVVVTLECEPVLTGNTVTLSPGSLSISCMR